MQNLALTDCEFGKVYSGLIQNGIPEKKKKKRQTSIPGEIISNEALSSDSCDLSLKLW